MQQDKQRQTELSGRSALLRPLVVWPAALILALVLAAIAYVSMGSEQLPRAAEPSIVVNRGASQSAIPAKASSPVFAPSEEENTGRNFIAQLNLQPRMKNGRVDGYVVRPDDPAVLNGTLLQPGDVLLEVDGLELDPPSVAALGENVGDYQDVYVRFERGSAQQEGILTLTKR